VEQLKKDTAIVICSRKKSRRIPDKAFKLVRGKPVIEHLIDRVGSIGIPVIIAVPTEDAADYARFSNKPNVVIETGSESDPLCRMHKVAQKHGLENIIRITHDKIFVDPHLLITALREFRSRRHSHSCMYLYSSTIPSGAGFEMFRYSLLSRAAAKYSNVEHLSYALRTSLDNGEEAYNFTAPVDFQSKARLLIDYPSDLKLMELLFMECGELASLRHVITWMDTNRWAYKVNRLPDVTVYTCAYNADKFLDACMSSVYQNMEREFFLNEQECFIEYLIVDDCSSDSTYAKALQFGHDLEHVTVIKNQVNQGLSSSSNIALDNAKGNYVMRLDADDFLVNAGAVSRMHETIRAQRLDALYPAYYDGDMGSIQKEPETSHHVGGAMFSLRALNHIRFTDGLRGHEGLDLYLRARKQMSIGYYREPLWFYRSRPDSMSSTDIEKRSLMAQEIRGKYEQ